MNHPAATTEGGPRVQSFFTNYKTISFKKHIENILDLGHGINPKCYQNPIASAGTRPSVMFKNSVFVNYNLL